MIHKKSTFFLGLFILLIPFLGFPSFWKTMLIFISGVSLISLSVKVYLPRKNTKPRHKKEKITPVFVENIPVYPLNDTIEKSQTDESST
jgi:hypothetical protein